MKSRLDRQVDKKMRKWVGPRPVRVPAPRDAPIRWRAPARRDAA